MAIPTSYMQGAHDFKIDHLAIHHSFAYTKGALEYLHDHIAVGAIDNSNERSGAPTCHPETRVAVQGDILRWIIPGNEGDMPMRILWLSGPAGCGKTAIAGSVAEACREKEIIAGTFFFSSYSPSVERHSKRCLVATLAYQLLQHDGLESMEQHVLRAIQRDPAIFKKRLKDQLEALILKPLRKCAPTFANGADLPKVLVIDGVDEVKSERRTEPGQTGSRRADEDDQLEVITCLLQAVNDRAFPFRILIASRPERVFTEFFSTHCNRIKRIFLNENYDPDSDIELYLRSKFAGQQHRYGLSPDWPGEKVIRRLVASASGQFIYAATVIRFVEDGSNPPPVQLECVLKIRPHDIGTNPFSILDATYTHILMASSNPRLAAMWLLALKSISMFPARFCRLLLEAEPGQGEHIMRPLASLISIPDPSQDREVGYRIYHKSLLDFLSDRDRCPALIYESGDGPTWVSFFRKSWLALLTNKAPQLPTTQPDFDYFMGTAMQPRHTPFFFWQFAEAVIELGEGDVLRDDDVYWWTSKLLSGGPHKDDVYIIDSQRNALVSGCWVIHRWLALINCTGVDSHSACQIIAENRAKNGKQKQLKLA